MGRAFCCAKSSASCLLGEVMVSIECGIFAQRRCRVAPLPICLLKWEVGVSSVPQDSNVLSRCKWKGEGICAQMDIINPWDSGWATWLVVGCFRGMVCNTGTPFAVRQRWVLLCCYASLGDCCTCNSSRHCWNWSGWCKFNMTQVWGLFVSRT